MLLYLQRRQLVINHKESFLSQREMGGIQSTPHMRSTELLGSKGIALDFIQHQEN